MTETTHNNQLSKESTTPEIMALLRGKHRKIGTVATVNLEKTREVEEKTEPERPGVGGKYEDPSGNVLIFAPTYKHIFNPATGRHVPVQYSLRDYFAHTAADGVNGPGWDSRFELSRLSNEQMLKRYGHVFTMKEIRAPMGVRNPETQEFEGGMPDDIPYYDVVSEEEYKYREANDLLDK